MSHVNIVAINAQIESLPALSTTVSQVIQVAANPESSALDMMNAVIGDQSMCSAILKVANSALFGMPREISTIERAIVILGYQEVKNIVIGKAIFGSFPKLSTEHRATIGLFWEHAFTCGLAAKLIAEHYRLSASEFFIAGLIHDIGKLAILAAFPGQYPILRELTSPSHFQNTSEERHLFGISHDDVGLQMANRWMLPRQLVMAVGYHHRPQMTPHHAAYPLIVQIADILSLMSCCSEIDKGGDVEKIFHDFLPEIEASWRANQLPLVLGDIGHWFERLQRIRDQEQDLVSLFGS